jgi:hypothetical protein
MEGMEFYPVLSTPLTAYVTLRWIATLAVAMIMIALFQTRRWLFVKPSIQLTTLYHVLYQWPAAMYAGYIETNLMHPWRLFWILDFYIFGCLIVSSVIYLKHAMRLFTYLNNIRSINLIGWPRPIVVGILIAVVVGISVAYLHEVSWTKTGLAALLYDPAGSIQAREESLKLLENRELVYAFSIMRSSVAPLLILLIAEGMTSRLGRTPLMFLFGIGIILVTILCVALPGDRYSVVRVMLGLLAWSWVRNGLKLRMLYIAVVFMALLPAALWSLLREGQDLSLLWDYLWLIVVHRVWATPLEVGTWYLDYVARSDIIGIAAFPRLAQWLGVDAIDAPNLIGLTYIPGAIESVSAGAGFIFSYFAYIGIAAPLLCIGLTLALDGILALYPYLTQSILVPTMACVALSLLAMVQGDFTASLITHGLIPVMIFAIILSCFDRLAAESRELINSKIAIRSACDQVQ